MKNRWEVIQGDCLDVMRGMDAMSVDSVVTDPPYGLKFMGKQWDHGVPGPQFWVEALRVAKPGAYLVAFGGTRTYHRLTCAIEDAGWEIRDCLSWLYGSGFPKSHNGPWGGTALKPGWEPIILARKPLIGTVAANAAEYGTGGLNIDGCRIDGTVENRGGWCNAGYERPKTAETFVEGSPVSSGLARTSGRWPANVVLDDAAAAMLDEQSGERGASGRASGRTLAGPTGKGRAFGARVGTDAEAPFYGDSGGASRFFYCAKPSRAERGIDNVHPTVKPIALMRWLCRLVTPAGGLVLDPFTGSGTTGCAAVAECFRFVGCEKETEYADIAEKRIASAVPEPTLGLEAA